MAKKGGLGKGLDALFIDNTMEVEREDAGVRQIPLTQIEPNKDQPRKVMDEEKIAQLAESMEQHGVIQPLIVRAIGMDRYQIVAGERRWRAARVAGLKELPVIIKEYSDKETAEIALVENLQREDLNPMEEAEGYQALMETYHMTQEEVAKRVGKSRPAVANALRLMQLPDDVMDLVKWGQLSAGHARALIPLGSRAMEGASQVINQGLSVRETEKLVKKMLKPEKETPKPKENPYLLAVESQLEQQFGRKVTVRASGKKGKVEFEYYSEEDLNTLLEMLSGLEH